MRKTWYYIIIYKLLVLRIVEAVIVYNGFLLLLSYLPNPSARAGYDTWSIFKRILSDLNSEYSFS